MLPEFLPAAARSTRFLLGSVAIACLGACANFSGIEPNAKALDASRLGLNNLDAERTVTDADWWLGFGDTQLNALVQTALLNNPG